MQAYQVKTGKFLCRDKYYGRKLSVDGFKEGIIQFLHNGNRLRTDAILPLVEKLEDLKATLLTLDTYRFYTSSLLLSYEGLDPELHGDAEEQQMVISEEEEEKPAEVVGRCNIPLSKSTDFQYPNRGRSLDNGKYTKVTTTASMASKTGPGTPPTSFSADNISNLAKPPTIFNNSSEGDISSVKASGNENKSIPSGTPTVHCLPSESVAVYVIDFAHATHANMGSFAKEHVGPDSGYIFGISNLIKVLREIHAEYCD